MADLPIEKKNEMLCKIKMIASRNYRDAVKTRESSKAEALLENLDNN